MKLLRFCNNLASDFRDIFRIGHHFAKYEFQPHVVVTTKLLYNIFRPANESCFQGWQHAPLQFSLVGVVAGVAVIPLAVLALAITVVLALAAGTGGSAGGGIVLLMAYSLGLGVPFLAAGLAFGHLTDLLARVQRRLRVVDLIGGVVLIAFGLLLVTGNVDVLSAHISRWLQDHHLGRLSTS